MASSSEKGRGPRIRPSMVDEEYKIQISKRINEFRDSDEQVLVFPKGLDNQERKYVHELCMKLGLLSKSTGSGDNRYLSVRKPIENAVLNERMPSLQLVPVCQSELARYFEVNPVTEAEADYVLGRSTTAFVKNPARGARRPAARGARDPKTGARPVESKVPAVIPSRIRLPTWKHRESIVQCIQEHIVTVVSGETGSGKSTQTVQYVLDAFPGSRILCTQPRRLSAIALAERVAEERGAVVGKEVGYSVRFETELSPGETRCTFCTTGVALSALRDGMGESGLFAGVTHLFVDEVHERDRNTDFLLIFIKELLTAQAQPGWTGAQLRVVLMSATINVQTFYNYFAEAGVKCATVAVEGSTFKVQPLFLEDVLHHCKDFASRFGSASGAAVTPGGESIEHVLQKNAASSSKLRCPLCGWRAKNVEDFGTHAATCQGALGVATKTARSKTPVGSEASAWEDVFDAGPVSSNNSKVEWQDVWGAGDASPAATTPVKELSGDDVVDSPDSEDDDERNILSSGVYLDAASGKWRAVLVLEEQEIELGLFDVKEQAKEKFLRALGKWSSSAGESALEDEEIIGEDAAGAASEWLLDGYLRSRAGEDELEVDTDLVVAVLEEIDRRDIEYFYPSAPKVNDDTGASAVLIFLPGWSEITALCDALSNHARFGNERKYMVLPLHSGIPSKEQRRVFARPPTGVRKIICATNIAETSLTIEDVVYVIDCGLVKEKGYDSFTRSSSLLPHFVSKASARQRRGRAGRCRPGVAFHLYSRRRFETMLDNQVPELLRTPLEEMCLHAKAIAASSSGHGGPQQRIFAKDATVADFLLKALDPPALKSILAAVQSLVALGAMDEEEHLTSLGMRLCAFPLEPRVAKTLLYGAFLGFPVPAISLAVASGARDPFVLVSNPAMRARAAQTKLRLASSVPQLGPSDHVAALTSIKHFLSTRASQDSGGVDIRRWCTDNFLSFPALESLMSMQRQVSNLLLPWERDAGHAPPASLAFAGLSALVCLATAPNMAVLRADKFACASHRRIRPHPSSTVSLHKPSSAAGARRGPPAKTAPDRFFVFEELCRNARGCTLRVLTEVSPLVLVLFGGNFNLCDPSDAESFRLMNETTGEFRLNAWAKIKCPSQTDAIRLAVLRLRLDTHLMTVYQRGRFSPEDRVLSTAIVRILAAQLLNRGFELESIPLSISPSPVSTPGTYREARTAVRGGTGPGSISTPSSARNAEKAKGDRATPRGSSGTTDTSQAAGKRGGAQQPGPARRSSGGGSATSRPKPQSSSQASPLIEQSPPSQSGSTTRASKRTPISKPRTNADDAAVECAYCTSKGHSFDDGCGEFDALPEPQKRIFREIMANTSAI